MLIILLFYYFKENIMKIRASIIQILTLLFFMTAISSYSQSAQIIDKMLSSQALTCGDACYLAGIMAGKITDDTPIVKTLELFRHIKGLENAKADDIIRYDVFVALVMDAGNIKGSIWYNLSKSPHYAFRYLKMEGLVKDDVFPSSKVDPRDAIAIISKLSEVQ